MNTTANQVNKRSKFEYHQIDSWTLKGMKKIEPPDEIPAYLEETYWWAYVRPYAINFFDREWIVNLILLGNMVKLRDWALNELGLSIEGLTVQIASVYGDFCVKLTERLTNGGSLDVVDVVPAQLANLRLKIPTSAPVTLIQSNSTNLKFRNEIYDQAVIFFLLHEMPADVREKTLSEALRVLKPGGKLVIVDFHKPYVYNPIRYIYPIMFKMLEPFALDIWNQAIKDWLPKDFVPSKITQETMMAGVYQKVVIYK